MVNTCQKLKVSSKHRLPAAANANNATNLGVTLAGKFYRVPSDSQGSRFLGLKRQESLGSYTHTHTQKLLSFPLFSSLQNSHGFSLHNAKKQNKTETHYSSFASCFSLRWSFFFHNVPITDTLRDWPAAVLPPSLACIFFGREGHREGIVRNEPRFVGFFPG